MTTFSFLQLMLLRKKILIEYAIRCNSNAKVPYEGTPLWKKILDYLTFENKGIIAYIIEGKGEVGIKNKLQTVIRGKITSQNTLCNDQSNREFFNKFVLKSALMTEYFLSLKDFPIKEEDFFIGSHFNDVKYLKVLSEFAEMPFEDLLWKEEIPLPKEGYGFLSQLFDRYKEEARKSYDLFKSQDEFYKNHLGVYYFFFLSPDIGDRTTVAKPLVIYPNEKAKILEVREANEDSKYKYAGFAFFMNKDILILHLSNYNIQQNNLESINEPYLVYVKISSIKRNDITVLKSMSNCLDTGGQPFAFRSVLYKTNITNYEMKDNQAQHLLSTEISLENIPDWCKKNKLLFNNENLEQDITHITSYLAKKSILKSLSLSAYQYNTFDLLEEKEAVIKLFAEIYKESKPEVSIPTEQHNFFADIQKQAKKSKQETATYEGTYRMLAIKNPYIEAEKDMITSKIVEILPTEYDFHKFKEYSPKGDIYEGITFSVNNILICSSLDFNKSGAMRDIQLMLIQSVDYDDNNIFFYGANLLSDYQKQPTFRYFVLQKINTNNINKYREHCHKNYHFKDVEQLIEDEPNDDLKKDLQKIVYYLLYQNYLGKAKISVPFIPSPQDLLKDNPLYKPGLLFKENLAELLNTTKQKSRANTPQPTSNNSSLEVLQRQPTELNFFELITSYVIKETEKQGVSFSQYQGVYLNFFKCKVKDKDHIGFNVVRLDEELNVKSKTYREDVNSTYRGIWLPILGEEKKGHTTKKINRGILLYTYLAEQQKITFGVGHYSTLKALNANKDILVGYYAGESIMASLFGGCDIFIKIEKTTYDELSAKELSIEKNQYLYAYFYELISTFENSLQENKVIDFKISDFLEIYHKI